MFRPATPLSGLVFLAFVLLLISILSTPIVKGIRLASFEGVDFGVFGYCKGSKCSGIRVGYDPDGQLDGDAAVDFSLPANTRRSLSTLLIVHPIAALFTLILLILSATAHLHSPAHSPRYMLILTILVLPTFLLSLLAFLVDILLFVPHMRWGGWLVLAATILIAVSGIVTCGMRRALVSRKAHHKRIAENAEMNGENYFVQRSTPSSPPLSAQPTVPVTTMTTTTTVGPDQLPEFATFDASSNKGERLPSQDERVPLNPQQPPSISGQDDSDHGPMASMPPQRAGTGSTTHSGRAFPDMLPSDTGGSHPPYPSTFAVGTGLRTNSPSPRLLDPNGRISPPAMAVSPGPMGGRGRGESYGDARNSPRGRGGYPGPWRPPPSQGMYGDGRNMGPEGMGGMMMPGGGSMGRGGYRGPTPGPGRVYPPGPYGSGPPSYMREQIPPGGYPGRVTPPGPGYGPRGPPGPDGPGPGPSYGGYGSRSPPPQPGFIGPILVRGRESPLPAPIAHTTADGVLFGQAVEMDANTGSPSPSQTPFAPNRTHKGQTDPVMTTSTPSDGPSGQSRDVEPPIHQSKSYVPARAGWMPNMPRGPPPPSFVGGDPEWHHEPPPVELPESGRRSPHDASHDARVGSREMYYEDVDPKFAEMDPVQPPADAYNGSHRVFHRPTIQGYPPSNSNLHPSIANGRPYEDMHEMTRSPAHSDTSNFTSISQRGVNPDWYPRATSPGTGGPPIPRQRPPQRDLLLTGNSDFEVGRDHGRGPPRPGPGMGYQGYPAPPGSGSGSGGGRYPG